MRYFAYTKHTRDGGAVMTRNLPLISLLLVPVVTLGMATAASSEPIQRSNWVPNVGERNFPEQPLDDMRIT